MRQVFSACPALLPERESSWRWWVAVWLPVVLAVCVIVIESTGTFSAENTSSWLRPIFESIAGRISDAGWETLHHYLRKAGHFLGYGTVALTFLRAWLHTRARQGITNLLSWRAECTVLAIFSTAMVASCDEFHQHFLPSRTGTPIDVLLDTSGACTVCLVVWLIFWIGSCFEQESTQS